MIRNADTFFGELPAPVQIEGVDPQQAKLLNAALWAPSAHNTQPWEIEPVGDGIFDLRKVDGDLDDPEGLIAPLTIGALAETMVLEAPNFGFVADVDPELRADVRSSLVARVSLRDAGADEEVDPLAAAVRGRHVNRNSYTGQSIPDELSEKLRSLGNVIVATQDLGGLIQQASAKSLRSEEFVADLKRWFSDDEMEEVGVTPEPFNIDKLSIPVLRRFVLERGNAPSVMAWLLSKKEQSIFESGPEAAVLSTADMERASVFEAGRVLLRSWVTVADSGAAYHPYHGLVHYPEIRKSVSDATGVDNPIAVYRVGMAKKPPKGFSNRESLERKIVTVGAEK